LKKHLLAVPVALFASALFLSPAARAEDPAPSPTPAVSPIPTFPEHHAAATNGGASTAAAGEASPLQSGVRIDRGGMFGAGFAVGNINGATAKVWFSPDVAAQFGAGSAPSGNNVRFQLDLLYSFYRFDSPDGQYSLPFYFGLGGEAGIFFKYPNPADRTDVGVRVPVGMSVVIPNNPVELFFEVAPDGALYDDTVAKKTRAVFYVDGQIGMRFYF